MNKDRKFVTDVVTKKSPNESAQRIVDILGEHKPLLNKLLSMSDNVNLAIVNGAMAQVAEGGIPKATALIAAPLHELTKGVSELGLGHARAFTRDKLVSGEIKSNAEGQKIQDNTLSEIKAMKRVLEGIFSDIAKHHIDYSAQQVQLKSEVKR